MGLLSNTTLPCDSYGTIQHYVKINIANYGCVGSPIAGCKKGQGRLEQIRGLVIHYVVGLKKAV